MKVSDISVLGRVTSGVKVISLAEDVTVASFTKVMREETSEAEELSEEEENPESENHSEE